MNYQKLNQEVKTLNFQRKNFFSVFGLYLFSLGTAVLGYSIYILFEAIGIVERSVTTWNAQGLYWFLILFCLSIFVLFIPVEFLNVFKVYNLTFKDLIMNIIFVIILSLMSLIFFQFFLSPTSMILKDLIDIGKAVSFSGFIAIPLILFFQHNLKRTIGISDGFSYSLTYFAWVLSSQIFL